MSKLTGPAQWRCDQCGANGGDVDEDETLPYQWLSIAMLCGSPQLRSESAVDRHAHLCAECSKWFLFVQLKGASDELYRLRVIFNRPPLSDASPRPQQAKGNP